MIRTVNKSRMMNTAIKLADTSAYGKFKLGAVIARKNTIISMGTNQHKTHSLQKRFCRYDHLEPRLHAEIHALSLARVGDLEGADIYVSRILRTGELRVSRPCVGCIEALKHYGIRRMHYYKDGEFYCEDVE